MSVATYTKAGAKATTAAKLNKDIFGLEVTSNELVRIAYEGFNSDSRDNLAVTKTRGLVRGGGRKPWKQKGTGRARFGSSRNPIWRTGGIVFGPTGEENYTTKINRKAKAKALKEALTLKSNANSVAVIDSLPTSGKTSELAKLASKLSDKGNVVFVEETVSVELRRAAANLPNVTVVTAGYLNVRRAIDADILVFTKAGMTALEARFGGAQ